MIIKHHLMDILKIHLKKTKEILLTITTIKKKIKNKN